MESIYRTNGTNQAIYIMGLLIQNIVELGAPYNRTLLKEMPVKLVCKELSVSQTIPKCNSDFKTTAKCIIPPKIFIISKLFIILQ